MGRVAIWHCHFYVFDGKFDNGHSHLTKWNFDSVEISSFLIKFHGIDFVSKVCPYSEIEKLLFFHVQKCWEINMPTSNILLDDVGI